MAVVDDDIRLASLIVAGVTVAILLWVVVIKWAMKKDDDISSSSYMRNYAGSAATHLSFVNPVTLY
jgi:hypothetical protein